METDEGAELGTTSPTSRQASPISAPSLSIATAHATRVLPVTRHVAERQRCGCSLLRAAAAHSTAPCVRAGVLQLPGQQQGVSGIDISLAVASLPASARATARLDGMTWRSSAVAAAGCWLSARCSLLSEICQVVHSIQRF